MQDFLGSERLRPPRKRQHELPSAGRRRAVAVDLGGHWAATLGKPGIDACAIEVSRRVHDENAVFASSTAGAAAAAAGDVRLEVRASCAPGFGSGAFARAAAPVRG